MDNQAESSSPETNKTPKSQSSMTSASVIVAFAVQCNNCYQWRKIATEEQFEDFRCNQTADPFVCNKLPGFTCEKPADISVDSSQVWVMDKPNIPKTPNGFKRITTLRGNYSKVDVQYLTPDGKKIRGTPGMVSYLQEHPEYNHLSLSDFCYEAPKIVRDTVPKHALKNPADRSRRRKKRSKS
ncbi:hypothetical protein QVD17_03049 [Tagetes erecta]|uniref:Uncharacterized protein n=1 Tax=Tagetes erecta TaxID=13708 RepID=A0AAD8LGT5_TARER|nr:hypothetical protein QVD17_03049 [Tagetes erecta]